MRSKTAAFALALTLSTSLATGALVALTPVEAQAYRGQGYDMFYDELADHGRWVDHPRYGWVWYPTRVRSDWRPYSEGRWVWTDRHGWYWDSYEPFGWATYHYGRWGYDDRYGYIWVPGEEWAPAWVSFRHSDEAIGWAPLPPETLGMTLLSLLSGGRSSSYYRYVDLSEDYYRPRWVFVPTRYFNDPRGYSHAYNWRDNDRYYRRTNNVTNYTVVNNYYVNRSIDPRRWESRTGHKVQTIQVRDVDNRRDWSNDRRGDDTVRVFHPRVEKDEHRAPPERARAKADDKPVVQVRPEFAAPEERRDRNAHGNERGNGRDNDHGRNDGRPDLRQGAGQPPAHTGQPDRNGRDNAQERAQELREQQQKAQQQKEQEQRAQQLREQQQKAQQQKEQEQRAQQLREQQQKAQQQKEQEQRAQQLREQQQKAQQQKQQEQRAQQQRAQQQREQQQKEQQQRAQEMREQQQKAAQQRAEQLREQRERAEAAKRAAPAQRPQQAERPDNNGHGGPQAQPQPQRRGPPQRNEDEEQKRQGH